MGSKKITNTLIKDINTAKSLPKALLGRLQKIAINTFTYDEETLKKEFNPKRIATNGRLVDAGFRYVPIESIVKAFALKEYDVTKTYRLIERLTDMSSSTVRKHMGKITKRLKNDGILTKKNLEILKENKTKVVNFSKNTKKNISPERLINKNKELLSFFNIPSERLKNKLEDILKNGANQSTEDYLAELYALRMLFLGKAKGEIVTTTTNTLWEVEFDEDRGKYIKKRINVSTSGKQYVNITTTSHLPDEKALVAIRLLDDMILQIEARSQVELTEEDLINKYKEIELKAAKEREEFLNSIIEEGLSID